MSEKMPLTIGNLVKLLDEESYWYDNAIKKVVDGTEKLDCCNGLDLKLRICFMVEKQTWVTASIDSPIFVPFYDVVPNGIEVEHEILTVWIDDKDAFPTKERVVCNAQYNSL